MGRLESSPTWCRIAGHPLRQVVLCRGGRVEWGQRRVEWGSNGDGVRWRRGHGLWSSKGMGLVTGGLNSLVQVRVDPLHCGGLPRGNLHNYIPSGCKRIHFWCHCISGARRIGLGCLRECENACLGLASNIVNKMHTSKALSNQPCSGVGYPMES